MRAGWKTITLNEACIQMNGIWKGTKEPLVPAKVLRTTNFSKDCRIKLDDLAIIDVEKKKLDARRLQRGDIIVEKSGGGPKQPVGRVILFDMDDDDYSFCNFTSALRIKDKERLDYNYLHKYLTYLYFEGETEKYQSNLVGFRNLDFKGYVEIEVPYPSLTEQQRIVDILDREFAKIDALKVNAEKSLQAAKDLFQATLKKELEPKEGWTQQELGSIADFKNGLNFGKEVGNFRFRFLGVGDFKDNLCVDVNTLGQIQKDEIDDDYLLHENDIVFVRSNGSKQLVGRCLLVKNAKEKATFSGFCIRCRLKGEALLPQYLIHFCTMDETKKYLTSSGEGCNISNLNQRVLSSLKVWAPKSREEQARIVAIIEQQRDNINDLQDNYQKTLTLCDDLKQSLLRKAFNGEL